LKSLNRQEKLKNRINLKTIAVIITILCISLSLNSQDIIGKDREAVSVLMKQDHKDFRMRNPPNVKDLSFYKFEHSSGDITLIAFFGEDGLCSNYQIVYDAEMLDQILESLNTSCQKKGEKEWICTEYRKKILVTLIEDEWFFTLNKKPLK
jgi:hypothetical protein